MSENRDTAERKRKISRDIEAVTARATLCLILRRCLNFPVHHCSFSLRFLSIATTPVASVSLGGSWSGGARMRRSQAYTWTFGAAAALAKFAVKGLGFGVKGLGSTVSGLVRV